MKITKLFAALMAVAAIATACETPEEMPEAQGKKISLYSTMDNFTRATDTAFEEGDKIGLHIILPQGTWLNNAEYTYTGGGLVGTEENFWYLNESTQSDVLAYYPYNATGTYRAGGYTFTVNADQSKAGNYTASDLMIAATTAKPTTEAVELPFRHALSKVVIKIDNQLEEEIEDVYFSEVYGTATVNLKSGATTTSGSKGTIKTASVMLNGEQAWSLILAPQQNVTPKLIVVTASQQYTFQLSGEVSFSAGKVSTATITLSDESIATAFTLTITDWVGDNDLQFGQSTEGGNEDVEGGYKIYAYNQIGWASMNIYMWDEGGNSITEAWAGTALTETTTINGYSYYVYTLPASANGKTLGVIFNNGTAQTADYTFTANRDYYFCIAKAGAAVTEIEDPAAPEVEIGGGEENDGAPIYLHPGVWDVDGAWFAAYFFSTNGDANRVMTDADGDGVFECGTPAGMTNVIFCRMNPEFSEFSWDDGHVWNQTEDLTIGVEPNNHYFVTDWTSGAWKDADYNPSTGGGNTGSGSGLGVVGSFAASNWADDVPLMTTETAGLLVAKNIEFRAYDAFKIRTAGTWEGAVNVGAGEVNYFATNTYFTVYAGGADIFVCEAGTYDVYFNQNASVVYLMGAGVDYTSATEQTTSGAMPDTSTMSWGLVGVHNGWGSGDTALVWDGTIGMYVAKSATLEGEFKVRADESWATNFGGANITVDSATAATMTYNSSTNCNVTAGTYDVYFWYDKNNIKANAKIWVKTVGSAAPSL